MEKLQLKLLCHSSKENGLKALSSSVVRRKPKHAKLSPGLQPVEKGSQQVDSTGSPMIMDEIEKAEIPPPETMTRMTGGLERLFGPQVKALWLHGEERRRSSRRDIDLNCVGLSAKMTRGVGAPELVD